MLIYDRNYKNYISLIKQRGSIALRGMFYVMFALILLAVLLFQLTYYQELGEKTLIDGSLRNMQIGIRAYTLANYASGQDYKNKEIITSNPIKYLKSDLVGYKGEFYTDRRPTEKGVWYYHIDTKQLVYIPRSSDHLEFLTETKQDQKLSYNREELKELRFYLKYEGTTVMIRSMQKIKWCDDELNFYDHTNLKQS